MKPRTAVTAMLCASLTFSVIMPSAMADAPQAAQAATKPSAPAVERQTTSSVTLKWADHPGANRYEVRYSTSSTFSSSQIVEKVNSRTVSNLKNATKYYFQYRALTRTPGTPAGTYDRSVWSTAISATTNALYPGSFTKITAKGGQDSLAVSWNKTANTTHYTVVVADDFEMKRNRKVIKNIKGTSYTVKKLSAHSRTGYPTFVKVEAHNKTFKTRVSQRITGYAAAPKVAGKEALSVATQNVLCATCVPEGKKRESWSKRVQIHLDTIKAENPDVILFQEAQNQNIPGTKTKTIEDLSKRLSKMGYTLDRTPEKGGTKHIINRVAYKKAKYSVVKKGTFKIPMVAGESIRGAAWVQLKSKKTGRQFLAVSTHISPRLPSTGNKSKKSSAQVITKEIAKINKKKLPVIVGGDLNSSFYEAGNQPHQVFMKDGWTDTASSANRTNYQRATTSQGTGTTMKSTYGRIDYLLTKNIKGTVSYKNVVKFKGNKIVSKHGSDHHMVVAKLKIG